MIAIKTKYLGTTNTRGTRIKASDYRGNQVTLSRDYALNASEDHERAAIALRDKMGWKGELVAGTLDNDTYVHVFKAGV